MLRKIARVILAYPPLMLSVAIALIHFKFCISADSGIVHIYLSAASAASMYGISIMYLGRAWPALIHITTSTALKAITRRL